MELTCQLPTFRRKTNEARILTKESKKYEKAEQRRSVNVSRKRKRIGHEHKSRTDDCPENDFDSLPSEIPIGQHFPITVQKMVNIPPVHLDTHLMTNVISTGRLVNFSERPTQIQAVTILLRTGQNPPNMPHDLYAAIVSNLYLRAWDQEANPRDRTVKPT